jgi:DNA-binding response OmpR family regulator
MAKKILVVEDDFDTLYPLAELLRLKGYDVDTSSNAEQGLEVAGQERPDLIITDIVMPGKSGLHLIQRVRGDESISGTPIVVITGCGPAILVEAESAGADCCIEKPIEVEPLFAVVERLIEAAEGSGEGEGAGGSKDLDRQAADELDRIVEQLRQATSSEEKEMLLKQIKESVFELHRKGASGQG